MADKTRFEFGKDLVGIRIKNVGSSFYTGLDFNTSQPCVKFISGQGDIELSSMVSGAYPFLIEGWGLTTAIRKLSIPVQTNSPYFFNNNRYYGNVFPNPFKGTAVSLQAIVIGNGSGAPAIDVDFSSTPGLTELHLNYEYGGLSQGSAYGTVNISGNSGLVVFSGGGDGMSIAYINSLNLSGCSGLTSFPSSNGQIAAVSANFNGCTLLTTMTISNTTSIVLTGCTHLNNINMYSCLFDSAGVDGVLAALVTNGATNGTIDISGTNGEPTAAGWASKATLNSRGWTVTVNGTPPEGPELIVNGTFDSDFSGWSSSGLSQGQGYQFGQTNEGAFGHNAQFNYGGGA